MLYTDPNFYMHAMVGSSLISGIENRSSLVNTEENCLFKIFALAMLSVYDIPCDCNIAKCVNTHLMFGKLRLLLANKRPKSFGAIIVSIK